MPALTLQQQFGANASMASGTLSIRLSDLAAVGLTSTTPSPADLAAALILLWKSNQGSNAEQDPAIGVTVGDSYRSIIPRGGSSQIQHQYPVSIYVPDNTSNLDPDDVV